MKVYVKELSYILKRNSFLRNIALVEIIDKLLRPLYGIHVYILGPNETHDGSSIYMYICWGLMKPLFAMEIAYIPVFVL